MCAGYVLCAVLRANGQRVLLTTQLQYKETLQLKLKVMEASSREHELLDKIQTQEADISSLMQKVTELLV